MFRSSVSYAIIGVVAKQKDLSIQSLHKHLAQKGVNVSLPNFYKVIAHMIDDQILIKPKGRVQLHALFMRYIASLTNDSQQNYLSGETNVIHRLTIGQQETWEESNLYDLNIIRTDLLGQLGSINSGTTSYHYTSHPYYLLSTPEKEIPTLENLTHSEEKSQILIGNTTVLDRYTSKILPKNTFAIRCMNNPPFPEQGYSVDIIGDYIVECNIPCSISDHFSMFFNTILGIEAYKKDLFCQVLKMKSPCSLRLIYSPEHAKKMKEKIEKAFR